MSDRIAINIPKKVDEYAKEVREKSPDYSEARVWATAWSIFCKHKDPGSEHCKKDQSEYFPDKSANMKIAAVKKAVIAARTAAKVIKFKDGDEGAQAVRDLEDGMGADIADLDWEMKGDPDNVSQVTLKGPQKLIPKAEKLLRKKR